MFIHFSKSVRQLSLAALLISLIFGASAVSAMTAAQDDGPEGFVPPSNSNTRGAETIPSPLFDPDEIGWLSIRDASSSAFSDFFHSKKDTHMMIDIEVDEVDGKQEVAGIWQVNVDSRGWAEKRNLTSAQFSENWNNYKDAGYRLIDQEAYLLDGDRFYAGIWVENKEGLGWASLRNLNNSEFSDKFAQYSRAGYMIIDVEAYLTKSNEMRYSMVWVENTENLDWREYRNLTTQQFSDKFNELKSDYRMIDVEGYKNSNGEMRYAGIWVENKNGRGWVELRNMTENRFRNEWYRKRDLGYRLIDFEKYAYGDGYRYAGIWRQNNDRPNWQHKSAVNNLIQAEIDQYDVSGIGVAIIKDGEFKYVRGFGHADIDNDIWYSSRTINRLASVSKAVAGVLGTHMHQDGQINIDALASAYEPSLPDHHTQTLRQLLANRGGIGHYADHGSANAQFDTALAGAQFFINDPLVYDLGTSCKYSTHGYTVFGLGVEGAMNDPIDQILDEQLSTPFGLGSLQGEDRSDGNWQRAKLYNDANNEIGADNISWKRMGGGLESNVYDLARLGNKVLNGTILNQASRDMLWAAPAPVNCSNYALGWNVGTDQGTMVVAKNGAQTGAETYIRMYPEHDIVIAILTNQWADHSPVQLGRDIGTLLLDNLSPAEQSQGLPFKNFNHLALGEAQILKDHEGNLVANGFGTTGKDGFKAPMPEAGGWQAEIGINFLPKSKVPGELSFHAKQQSGRIETEIVSMSLKGESAGFSIEPSFAQEGTKVQLSHGAWMTDVIIYPNEKPVPTAMIDWDEIFCVLDSPLPLWLASRICRLTIEYGQNANGESEWTLTFEEPVSVQIAGGKEKYQASQIKLIETKSDAGRASAVDSPLSAMEVFGKSIDQLVIYDEEVVPVIEKPKTTHTILLPIVVR